MAGAEVVVGVGHRCGAEERAVNPTARTGAETQGSRPATAGSVRDSDSPLEGPDLPPMIKQKKRGGNPA
jgi:hypothetical protein